MRKRNLKKLIVISNALQEEYHRLFPELPADKILVAPDGADIPEEVPEAAKTSACLGEVTIGYVGSLYPVGVWKSSSGWRKGCLNMNSSLSAVVRKMSSGGVIPVFPRKTFASPGMSHPGSSHAITAKSILSWRRTRKKWPFPAAAIPPAGCRR